MPAHDDARRPPESGQRGQGTVSFDELAFRRTLGHLATGVTVMSTHTAEGVHGMTANAVTSVSLDPPLILICLDRRARMAHYAVESGRFAINLLRETQEPLSRYFARTWQGAAPEHRFEEWAGVPYVVGSLGALSCRVAEVLNGGDHLIVLGRVVGLRVDDPTGRPLLFYRGRYAGLVEHEASPPQSPELESREQIQINYGEWWQEEENDPPTPPPHPWFP